MAGPSTTRYDVVVIGSGIGGYVAAIRASQLGLATAIVEREPVLGGTCLNVGCIPSKALLESTELYETVRSGLAAHGITTTGVSLDLAAMMARKESIVATFDRGVAALMEANGIAVFHGTGRLASPTTVAVAGADGSTALEARAVILATGSVPTALPPLPFDGTRIISSTEALALRAVPRRLVVVGAGAVGLELGSVWLRLGSEVTVLELAAGVLPGWDTQAAQTLQRLLSRQGMRILTSAAVTGARPAKDGVSVVARLASGEERATDGDVVLVAVGRRPAVEGLGLEQVGVQMERGRVKVDGKLRTTVPTVYAIGDLVCGPMLAHKAADDGIAAAENIAGGAGFVDHDLVPSVVYTAPEVASVGATEDRLRESATRYVSGSFVFRANGRALALARPDGFVKVLADAETDRLLGFHVVGPLASELVAEAVTVMAFGGSAEDIARTVHAHPSLSEVTHEAALAAEGRPINQPGKKGGSNA